MPASHCYRFDTEWTVEGDLPEVASVLKDVEAFPGWWRPVYLSAKIVDPGQLDGLGRTVEFTTRGFLPYVLRWLVAVVESNEPNGFAFRTSGDLAGEGIWELRQDGERVRIRLQWQVCARKTVVRQFSFVLRSLFSRNHRWAMARGEEGLQAELKRRRRAAAATATEPRA